MVNFSVFNELSLPLDSNNARCKFGILFGLLEPLKNRGVTQIRMSDDFKNYQILKNTSFDKFIGQQQDKDFKTRLRSFVGNNIIKINSPIIHESEQEQRNTLYGCEYYYNNRLNDGGLACCDIWNAIAISFDTDEQWKSYSVTLKKVTLTSNSSIKKTSISIKHASNRNHLKQHKEYFDELETEKKS